MVGDNWLVAIGWWQLVGDNWLVASCWWQLVGGKWRRPTDVRAYIRPLESTKRCACHANHTHTAAAKHRAPGRTSRGRRAPSAAPAAQITHTQRPRSTNHTHAAPHDHQGVHPTRWRAPNDAPATQITPAQQRRPRSTRAYIRPLENAKTIGW